MIVELGKLLGSRTGKSCLSFASSGLSFAVANVIFANQLNVNQYGVLALLIAILMLAASVGMMGADGIVNRHSMAPDMSLFGRVALSAIGVGAIAAFLAAKIYGVRADIALLLLPAIVAFAIARFCGAYLQSRMRLVVSLFFSNSLNYLLLAMALWTAFVTNTHVHGILLSITVLQCMIAAGAVVLVRSQYSHLTSDYVYNWREALACILLVSSAEVLVQLDRLLTPRLLTLHDLAVLGVLLALIGPPFRLLYLALGYDLLPVLRRADGHSERVSLLTKHLILALLLIVPLWALIWFGAPLIQRAFLSNAYRLSDSLILAALVAGTIKALSGIAKAGVTALGSVRSMEIAGAVGWASIGICTLSAWYGSRFGLEGVIYGVGFGWLVRLLAVSYIVARALDADGRFGDDSIRIKIVVDQSTPEQ